MDHKAVLNDLLASMCPSEIKGDTRTFSIDCCCSRKTLKVRLVSDYQSEEPIQYEILSYT